MDFKAGVSLLRTVAKNPGEPIVPNTVSSPAEVLHSLIIKFNREEIVKTGRVIANIVQMTPKLKEMLPVIH